MKRKERDLPEQLPDRPLVTDEGGIRRFRANAIVKYLLEAGPFDMNSLAAIPFAEEDRREFAQLIGYSVNGYRDLSYARAGEEVLDWAEAGELARSLQPSPGCPFCGAEEAHLGSEACNRSLKQRLAKQTTLTERERLAKHSEQRLRGLIEQQRDHARDSLDVTHGQLLEARANEERLEVLLAESQRRAKEILAQARNWETARANEAEAKLVRLQGAQLDAERGEQP